jgi:hypothetical protein
LARRNAAHCFMGGPKRQIQPERYTPFFLEFSENSGNAAIRGGVNNILTNVI